MRTAAAILAVAMGTWLTASAGAEPAAFVLPTSDWLTHWEKVWDTTQLPASSQRIDAGESVDLVVPVPLSARRLRERGYNQSAEIARRLRRAPLELFLCERSRDTAAQMELPWAERRRNVRGAFRCTRSLSGTVAVVDDVMTTGTTLDEVAATLKRAGAARVVNWVVARTYV